MSEPTGEGEMAAEPTVEAAAVNAPWANYPVISENPNGSYARASMLNNVWLITCNNCGTYDIVGPGHPATEHLGDGVHGYGDRTALRHSHAEGCEPNEEGNYSLDHSFMIAPPAMRKPSVLGSANMLLKLNMMMMRAMAAYKLTGLMAGMTDQTLVNTLLSNLLHASTTATWTPGTGGTALTITPPILLRLYSTTGTEAATGTQLVVGTSPGYVAGGLTMGTNAFGAFSSGAATNTNQVQFTATGTWTLGVTGVECFDSSGTPVRILWGALTSAIIANAVVNTDTVTFAAAALSASGATW